MASAGIAGVSVSSFMEPVVQADTALSARDLLGAKGNLDNVKTVIAAYTALTTDDTLICSSASGFTVTLFTAVGNAGKRLSIVNTGTGEIIIDGSGDETIGGIATQTLFSKQAIEIISDGTNWQILSNPLSNVYPIGSIYTSVMSTNPATLFGFGTWESFGAGRVLVGLDATQTEFDTVEETGGEKTHLLTAAESGLPAHQHYVYGTTGADEMFGGSGFAGYGNTSGAYTLANPAQDASAAHNNLQPYVIVYFFKRVS